MTGSQPFVYIQKATLDVRGWTPAAFPQISPMFYTWLISISLAAPGWEWV
jgi:hypothetical protein